MIGRLAFYVVEAGVLAGIAGACLELAARGLRRLGVPIRLRWRRLLPALWLAFALVGIVFGERFGPEFVYPYHYCFWLAIASGTLWLVSFARAGALAQAPLTQTPLTQTSLTQTSDREPEPAQGRGHE